MMLFVSEYCNINLPGLSYNSNMIDIQILFHLTWYMKVFEPTPSPLPNTATQTSLYFKIYIPQSCGMPVGPLCQGAQC